MIKCAGVCVRGYRKGEPCGGVARFKVRDKDYCASHVAIALKEPNRFRSAIACWVRAEARREVKRRFLAAQIDAFPVDPGFNENCDVVHG